MSLPVEPSSLFQPRLVEEEGEEEEMEETDLEARKRKKKKLGDQMKEIPIHCLQVKGPSLQYF